MKKEFKKIFIISSLLFALPILVWAFPNDLAGVMKMFTEIGLKVVPLLGAVAFLVFVWGVARFIRSAGSEKEIKDSKNLLIWGLVGLFVLVTIWGIIFFLQGEFGFKTGNKPIIPQIDFNKK